MIWLNYTRCYYINWQMQQDVSLGSFQYNYIKALSFYEKKVVEGRELNFRHHLLPPPANQNTFSQTAFEQLRLGNNINQAFALTIFRVRHLKHCSYLLATSYKPFDHNSLVIVVVVMPPEEHPQKDMRSSGLAKKSEIQVFSPFCMEEEEEEDSLPILIVTFTNLKIIKNFSDKRLKRTSQQLRQQANCFFKAKKYVQAIHLYEAALTNIHHFDQRKLSVLYSNTAACLFELRLYQSCIKLSQISIMLDPTYNKGYYRKIRSLLQLRRFSEITPLMLTISNLIGQTELEALNEKYINLIAQDTGVFNWQNLLRGTCPQGEYYSSKIKIEQIDGELKVIAKEPLQQFELVMVSRPLIYIQESGSNFKESFMSFLKQIENYYLYDQEFEESIYLLPCKCHPCLPQREQCYEQFKGQAHPLPKKQLFNKMQRCIFQEKSLDKPNQENGYGIWKQMFYFQNKCSPNCSGIHINGFWMVSALKPIEVGTFLSIDLFAGVQGTKRKETLSIKMQQQCECQICGITELSEGAFTTIQNLYDQIEVLQSAKKKKMHIWNIINSECDDQLSLFEGDFVHLIYYYIYYIQKEYEWDDFLNLLRLKDENDHEEINKNIDQVAIRLLSHFLKATDKEAEKIYKIILDKVIYILQE